MTAKDHYDNLLGNFYSWMIGDFILKVNENESFFKENIITSSEQALAIDLGCGNGIQSIALANLGYKVVSVDFNKQLLLELYSNKADLPVLLIENDILDYLKSSQDTHPELIVCMGDTISHLSTFEDVEELIRKSFEILKSGGKLVLSFRDYSMPLEDTSRFIPVKSDDYRIMTCFLEYGDTRVTVTDLVYEKHNGSWHQKVSSYKKLRMSQDYLISQLQKAGFKIDSQKTVNRMIHLIAKK